MDKVARRDPEAHVQQDRQGRRPAAAPSFDWTKY
jgi:hypothetical protein